LALANVTVRIESAFTATLAGEKAALTVGGAGVTVMSAMHAEAAVPAWAGARVLALTAENVTTAVSVLPTESVTTSVKLPDPVAMTFTAELEPPETMCIAGVLVQA
jgi:hypothetical protein